MMKCVSFFILIFFVCNYSFAQQKPDKLTVEKIMRDSKWIGTSPSNIAWSPDGQYVYFNWNPDNLPGDSLYSISLKDHHPAKVSAQERQGIITDIATNWNESRTAFVYAKDGDIFFRDIKRGIIRKVLQTTDKESNPQFSFDDKKIVYLNNQNLYAWDIATGETMQLTNLQSKPAANASPQNRGNVARGNRNTEVNIDSVQEDWLKKDQLQYLVVLKERKEKKEATDAYNKSI